jgi:hypothetical protein
MVFCIIGIVIFGILGIFSAKYRRYFRESLHCIGRQLVLKKCDSKFDDEMKSKISASLSKVSPAAARFVYKRFAALSWVFVGLMAVSIVFMGIGVYNYVAYGNCNGPLSNDFCIFNPLGTASDTVNLYQSSDPAIRNFGEGAPTLGNPDAPVKIIEVGCFSCPYTRDAESVREQILAKYGGNVSFSFIDMPLPTHQGSHDAAEAAKCAEEQGAYWEYHDALFANQGNFSIENLKLFAANLGLNPSAFNSCLDSHKYQTAVENDYKAGLAVKIHATPTYFINGAPVVGLKAFAQLENIIISDISGSCPAPA